MNIIDTHSHLYLEEFDADRSEVLQRARDCGVSKIVMPAINMQTMSRLLTVCQENPDLCYPLVGLHPEDVDADYLAHLDLLYACLQENEDHFYGIGEVGLDFYWDQTYKAEQIAAFEIQIGWAIERDLPLVIHSRSAHKELVSTLYKYKSEHLRGIFHCFSGNEEECKELLEFDGFLLGIGGVLTFKKSNLPDVLKDVPLSRIVVETDSPYLAPVPYRGKRNESSYVCSTVAKLAELYGLSIEETAQTTTENAEKLFFCHFPLRKA